MRLLIRGLAMLRQKNTWRRWNKVSSKTYKVSSRSIDFVAFLTKFRLSHYGVSICLWTWITSSSLNKTKTKENLKYNGRNLLSNHFVRSFSFRLLLEGNSSPVLSPWERERLERDPGYRIWKRKDGGFSPSIGKRKIVDHATCFASDNH